ncbi:hypothetical protein Bca4012_054056 [Brassica carinata]
MFFYVIVLFPCPVVPPCAGDNYAYASVLHGKGLRTREGSYQEAAAAAAGSSASGSPWKWRFSNDGIKPLKAVNNVKFPNRIDGTFAIR